MGYQYTPYIWILLASAAITGALGIYAWRHRTVPAASQFALIMAIAVTWSVSYALEIYVNETVPQNQWIWWDLGFLAFGALLVVIGWLLIRTGQRPAAVLGTEEEQRQRRERARHDQPSVGRTAQRHHRRLVAQADVVAHPTIGAAGIVLTGGRDFAPGQVRIVQRVRLGRGGVPMERTPRDEEREERITMEIVVDAHDPEEQARSASTSARRATTRFWSSSPGTRTGAAGWRTRRPRAGCRP
ncbi:MAG: hypothetical protein HY690_11045 [Chloroflexi bacterium]|nr:hypothetical protein [Chloroflexota bacterium]